MGMKEATGERAERMRGEAGYGWSGMVTGRGKGTQGDQ